MPLPDVKKVKYPVLRRMIEPGDIWLCSGKAIFSKMIKFATGSEFTHVGFVMRLKSIDRVVVMESVESVGVRVVPTSQYIGGRDRMGKKYRGRLFLGRHKDFRTKALPNISKFGRFAVDQLGYPYDKDEIAKIAYKILIDKKREKKSKPDKEFICSEYAYECYKRVGISIKLNRNGFIAPSDFVEDPKVKILAELDF